MNSTSVIVRLRRTSIESAHVAVPMPGDDPRAAHEPRAAARPDAPRLHDMAIQLGHDTALAWQTEAAPLVEVHPLQTPPPAFSPRSPEEVARRWLACFAGHDLDGLLELYCDDAVHTSPKIRVRFPDTGGQLRGKAALRSWWADAFARIPGLGYELTALTVDRRRAFMEYVRKAPGDPDLPVAEVLELGEDGRIIASHVYHG
jgi:hypothetical protein